MTLSNFSCAPWSFIPLFFFFESFVHFKFFAHCLTGLFVFFVVCLFCDPMNFGSFSNQWGQEKIQRYENVCVCVYAYSNSLYSLNMQGIKQAPLFCL